MKNKFIPLGDYIDELYPSENMYNVNNMIKVVERRAFEKRPIELGQFIRCDLDGNVLEEPDHYNRFLELDDHRNDLTTLGVPKEYLEYKEAESRILFEGNWVYTEHQTDLNVITDKHLFRYGKGLGVCLLKKRGEKEVFVTHLKFKTLEDLSHLGLILTDNAFNK